MRCLRHKHSRPPTTLFKPSFNTLLETSNFGASVTKLIYTTAVDCRPYRKTFHNKKIEIYSLREGTEAWEDGGSEIDRERDGGKAGRRLVTGVRSGWERASRSWKSIISTSSSS